MLHKVRKRENVGEGKILMFSVTKPTKYFGNTKRIRDGSTQNRTEMQMLTNTPKQTIPSKP
jgi:hypothetical protein